VSIVVSSHLLLEVEAICDHLVLIDEGTVSYAGTVKGITQGQTSRVVARPAEAAQLDELRMVAQQFGEVAVNADGTIAFDGEQDLAAQLNKAAFEAGILLSGLGILRPTLEQAFFAMTEKDED
jgi:ABC-2 type transport system ATP-binding protein